MKTLFLLAILALSQVVSAQEGPALPAYACAFERPFIFGASVSAGLGLPEGMRGNPVTKIAEKYFYYSAPQVTNIAEMINSRSETRGYGHRQLSKFIRDPQNLEILKKATLLASVDGSYWVAGDHKPNNDVCDEGLAGLQSIMDLAKENNKPLILGTVPHEDPEKVKPMLRNHLGWYGPKLACLQAINEFLRKACLPENQCYVIDVYAIVHELNSTGIFYRGKLRTHFDMRTDGVHLSPLGVAYTMEKIEHLLDVHPPTCPQK